MMLSKIILSISQTLYKCIKKYFQNKYVSKMVDHIGRKVFVIEYIDSDKSLMSLRFLNSKQLFADDKATQL